MRISDWSSDVCSSDLLNHGKAVETRHLDVEEDEIGLVGLDRADRLAAIGAGLDDLDILMLFQAQLQPLDGKRLVVHQDRADGHFGSDRKSTRTNSSH